MALSMKEVDPGAHGRKMGAKVLNVRAADSDWLR